MRYLPPALSRRKNQKKRPYIWFIGSKPGYLKSSPSYATNIDYLRYENLSIRLESNVLLLDFPDLKSTCYFDLGWKYGHTPIVDTLFTSNNTGEISKSVIDLDAYNFTIYPKLHVDIFAERRYGFSVTYYFNSTFLFSNNNFKQVLSYSGKGDDLFAMALNKTSRFSHSF